MSKEPSDDFQLWYRPRTEPSGTINVPSEKFASHHETQGLISIPPEPSKPAQCELQDLLIVTSEGTTSVDSSESSKKKPQQGSKSQEPKKKRSHKKKETGSLNSADPSKSSKGFEPIVIVDDNDTPKTKKSSSAKKAVISNSAEKNGKQDDAKSNGKALQESAKKETVKKLLEAVKSGENAVKKLSAPITPTKPSDTLKPSIETPSKPADSLPKPPESALKSPPKLKKILKAPDTAAPISSSSENKNVKSECSEFIFQCPNSTCSQSFPSSEDFITHIKNSHSLRCRMPFCTFSTFTFKEYCEHFEIVHCVGPALPQKRGPRVSLQEADSVKEAKTK